MRNSKKVQRSWRRKFGFALLTVAAAILPLAAQSDRSEMLLGGGAWHLHSRVPLGGDSLLLQPGHRVVQMLATAEAPEFEGWSLIARQNKPALINASGKAVQSLPGSIVFRVTVGTRDRLGDPNPMPFTCTKSLNDFLLDMHFRVQVFRGMAMREIRPTRTWMIGIPADETSDERIYRTSFNLGDIRPDDRIVLLVTDGAGARLSKFHLEFL